MAQKGFVSFHDNILTREIKMNTGISAIQQMKPVSFVDFAENLIYRLFALTGKKSACYNEQGI